MEEFVKRVKEVCVAERLTREELAKWTGMEYSRWHNLMNGRGTIRSKEIENTCRVFSHYTNWLIFGSEREETPQISPETKLRMTAWWKSFINESIELLGGIDNLVEEIKLALGEFTHLHKYINASEILDFLNDKKRAPLYAVSYCVKVRKDRGWKPTRLEQSYIDGTDISLNYRDSLPTDDIIEFRSNK